MQEINTKVIDDGQERYQFTWPDKRKSMVMANTPISKTLRLEKEKSVGRDGTPGGVDSENIYIEGDNLDALKLLQETYLGKVKMIYIDPPYNTGNDFIYEDDFAQSSDEYADNSGQTDEEGNRLVQNSESNGRFHTDWLNMIYPRLRLARDFLTDDGVIFISIDENEVQNLRKVCDEIFGEANFVSQLGWQKVYSPKNQAKYFSNDYEYVLCYAKKIENFKLNDLPRTEEMNARYKNPDNDPRGDWKPGDCIGNGERKNGNYTVISPITGKAFTVPQGKHWVYAPKKMEQLIKDNRIYFGKDGNSIPSVKQFLSEMGGRKASSLLMYDDYGHTDMAKKDLKKLFPELEKIPFPTPKPVKLVKTLAKLGTNKGDVIMDFFAGSATSAQSILDLNSEMHMHRKFILVQSGEEKIEKNQKAELLGIKTISDLAQVRIRRAGKKIKEETAADIDYGFRFFKVDSSNMKDVYHAPADVEQLSLDCFEDNIKEDRTPEDLLIQVMLDLGILLSSDIETQEIAGKKVFSVADDYLLACFDKDVTEETVIEIAKKKPFYAVFRDNSMANDSVAANFEQIFETYSPETVRKVL
ncbi:site-specific DNA-methyltransferase [Lactobacillus delbrueckii]|uniref:site-specific DNA-methyltransferase n=3 Tax=Bacilli TaxID=91061 RepID=UPI001E4F6331|nr:site-specific DNA-methyltransferase [Lactobacillus delbrueckii]MCD5566118.1 site-specific DNA-methyltransferase [Lactobacillus delbrueckii subsp. lactis]